MKILYCIVGNGAYAVLENDIINKNEFFIYAKRAFSIEMASQEPQMIHPARKGVQTGVTISTYEDVRMNCIFISVMSEKAPLYQKFVELVEQEHKREN